MHWLHYRTDRPISIHSPRMGRDLRRRIQRNAQHHFNPLSPHGERQDVSEGGEMPKYISIHSPRMGRDPPCWRKRPLWKISIHSPRMGRDQLHLQLRQSIAKFQSTLPAWGETTFPQMILTLIQHFNPLSPHGERQGVYSGCKLVYYISIHSPRMGRDSNLCNLTKNVHISIHSPRMGRDVGGLGSGDTPCRISIHSPRMGRDQPLDLVPVVALISIHSPRMGRDSKRTQLFEEKNWRICTTLYLFASKGVLPADKKTF